VRVFGMHTLKDMAACAQNVLSISTMHNVRRPMLAMGHQAVKHLSISFFHSCCVLSFIL
jgi:hypothetical protein